MIRRAVVGVAVSAVLGMAQTSLASEDGWVEKTSMPTARFGLSTSVVNGKIYAIGGGIEPGVNVRNVEEYDPATDTWTQKADMPDATCWHSTSAVNGKIYSIGGWENGVGIDTVVEYDPATDTWRERAPLPTPRKFLSTSVVNGKIYAIGGETFGGSGLGTVEEYDPATDTWTTKADMPTPRELMCTSVVDGIIYAIGGGRVQHVEDDTVEAYDPATDTWTTKAPIPTARAFFSTSVVDGKVYAIGGCTGWYDIFTSNTVEVYDPATDTWAVAAEELQFPRAALSTSVVNGTIYAIGGDRVAAWRDPVSTVEELTVAPLELSFVYWLEVAANLPGSFGSEWVTDLVLFNEADTVANVLLVLHSEGVEYEAPATVMAGGQGVFADVVGGTLQRQGKGLLEVRADHSLRGAARTYNLAPEGTFGQAFGLNASDRCLVAGDSAWLLELRQEQELFRTNIAVCNTGDADASVRIRLFATDGTELHVFNLELEPRELIQELEPFSNQAGRPNVGWGMAKVEEIAGSGVLASASVIDSRTNDATTVAMHR